MIQHGILDLDAIYDMLGPDDSLIQESAEKEGYHEKEKIGGDVTNVKDLYLRESRCQITLVGLEEEQLGY